ncbi:TPA: hypothetical protein N1999_001822 [Pseudomonas aeruginosa]|nr:hypothetical protein [Pseudomonas aeruginosa]
MTESKICTCPSGDGSLRWPCPAHPAVDQADVAAKLTFINGRPAMCGCQVEYSDGGGEYSDVIYVTLCAKHSGSAILDLVATNRIALTPEYEGQWHADLYLDREIPLAKVEGATPAEAVLALMSAERIDPEQESVEQAGGDERAAFERFVRKHCGMPAHIAVNWDAKFTNDAWEGWQARAALAQPSPKCATCNDSGQIVVSGPHYQGEFQPPEYETEPCDMCAQPSPAQAEAEQPEVVARVDGTDEDWFIQPEDETELHNEGLLFAGCELGRMIDFDRIVGALRAEIAECQEAAGRSRSDVVAYIAERAKLLEERDSQQRLAIKAMEEVAALRARVVVPDRRDPLNSTGDDENPRYAGFNECLDELARINGLTVSEGLLRRVCAEQPATCCMDDEMSWRRDRDSALIELRALLNEDKENGNG